MLQIAEFPVFMAATCTCTMYKYTVSTIQCTHKVIIQYLVCPPTTHSVKLRGSRVFA